MLSYHNDAGLKTAVLAEMAEHRRQDNLVQGYGYWEDGKGCAIGCLIKSGDHAQYETRFGIPEELAHLEDKIFEGLPREQAKLWPERFLGAIPVGVDLSRVRWRFLHWLLTDPSVNPGIEHDLVRDAVKAVADLCMSAALGEMPSEDRWSARSAAWSAWSAERSAWSAERSARSAAESAAWSARSAAWERMSEALLRFLEEAAKPIPFDAGRA